MRGPEHVYRRRLVRRRPPDPCTGRAGGRSPSIDGASFAGADTCPDVSITPEDASGSPATTPSNAPVRLEPTVTGTAWGTAALSFDSAGAAASAAMVPAEVGASASPTGAASTARSAGATGSAADSSTAGTPAASAGVACTGARSSAAGVATAAVTGVATATGMLPGLPAEGGGIHMTAPASSDPAGRTCIPLFAASADSTTRNTRTETCESAERRPSSVPTGSGSFMTTKNSPLSPSRTSSPRAITTPA